MNQEFAVHILTDEGINNARIVADAFDILLDDLSNVCPEGREFAIVKTKLEEACFFAKKSMASANVK